MAEQRSACPVCAAPIGQSEEETPAFRRCATCGLVFRPSVEYPEPEEGWEEYWTDDDLMQLHLQRMSAFEEIARLGTKAYGGAGDWLDVGCGVGVLLAAATKYGWQVTGIEPAISAVEGAARRLPKATILHRSAETGLDGVGEFDMISMTDVLRCIPEPLDALRECVDHLRPGGWLLIRECDARKRHRARAAVVPTPTMRPSDFAQEFAPASMTFLFRRLGLTAISCVPSPLFSDRTATRSPLKPVIKQAYYQTSRSLNAVAGSIVLTPNFITLGQRPEH